MSSELPADKRRYHGSLRRLQYVSISSASTYLDKLLVSPDKKPAIKKLKSQAQ